ncbi:hypothetical protein Tco_1239982, partial [Tanacetum coccineum]
VAEEFGRVYSANDASNEIWMMIRIRMRLEPVIIYGSVLCFKLLEYHLSFEKQFFFVQDVNKTQQRSASNSCIKNTCELLIKDSIPVIKDSIIDRNKRRRILGAGSYVVDALVQVGFGSVKFSYGSGLIGCGTGLVSVHFSFHKDVGTGLWECNRGNLGQRKINVSPISDTKNLFFKKISCTEAANMARNVNDEEIKAEIFDIDGNKALGPDGYSS